MSRPNRRNLYRLLHVQPGAPVEVIKASYRVLMGTLRAHPDLGGDHEQAALLNEAWAVLGDADRRAAYDRELAAKLKGQRKGAASSAAGASARAADSHASPAPAAPKPTPQPAAAPAPAEPAPPTGARLWRQRGQCPLCQHTLPPRLLADSRCASCDSPLSPAPDTDHVGKELFGRRASLRMPRDESLTVQLGKAGALLPARWRDMSLTGLSFLAPAPLPAGRVLRIRDHTIDALAEVVSCHGHASQQLVHARLLTARFLQPRGQFVSTSA
ncbi:DnaJ domain-containing protein [Ideonella margarita]|uniref:DnaJ domain-containing protein n=1 Tax=Ideonella margarita TaxID=2984191 RepID=A0ABU9C6C3_9BURK